MNDYQATAINDKISAINDKISAKKKKEHRLKAQIEDIREILKLKKETRLPFDD